MTYINEKRGSKKAKAQEILDMLHRGPAREKDGSITAQTYNIWMSTWIVPYLPELIPQLNGEITAFMSSEDMVENRAKRVKAARAEHLAKTKEA